MNIGWLNPDQITETVIADINALLLQLTDAPQPLDLNRAIEIATESHWVVARDEENRIKGINTLTISQIPTGRVGHLDDVVVDKPHRGKGVGRGLVEFLVNWAVQVRAADRIELTSKPSRVEANGLYLKLGFQKRETNCYVLNL